MTQHDSGRPRTGGQIVAECLRLHGVDTVFTVPGESFLAVLDGLYDLRDQIRLVVCRQEGGAAYMAEAYGKLTGRPAALMVTRGPGATNASVGVHTAFQDSTPLLVLIGQVERAAYGREAFQEVDLTRMYDPLTKYVTQVEDPGRLPEVLSRAFHTTMAGRPGPVAIALPEDMLRETASVPLGGPYKVVRPSPSAQDMERLRGLLGGATAPLMVVGGGGWSAETARLVMEWAGAHHLPTAASFRCQDYFDNLHPSYVGHLGLGISPTLLARIRACDLLIVVGARLGEITTAGYTLIDIPRPAQTLVHVHADAEELGRVYQADLPINSGSAEFASALAALRPADPARWRDGTARAHAEYRASLEPIPQPGALDMGEVMRVLRGRLPADAIMANGAGNFSAWVHRFYPFRTWRTQLAPTNGSMGYGVPAAITASLLHPGRPVICFTGDGDFLMNGQELATAVGLGVTPLFLVINNNMYGTIRMHQEREHPGRVHGSDLVNPDFAALARAFGAFGEIVEKTADFEGALERALGAGRPALLELRIDPESITPQATLTAIRDRALARQQSGR